MTPDEFLRTKDEREGAREEFGRLFAEMAEILFRLDPIRINRGVNPDEYEPEVGTIIPRLRSAMSQHEAHTIIHEEFVRWFGPNTAGPVERYDKVAEEVWSAWLRWHDRS
jgi:hypothetical protein